MFVLFLNHSNEQWTSSGGIILTNKEWVRKVKIILCDEQLDSS